MRDPRGESSPDKTIIHAGDYDDRRLVFRMRRMFPGGAAIIVALFLLMTSDAGAQPLRHAGSAERLKAAFTSLKAAPTSRSAQHRYLNAFPHSYKGFQAYFGHGGSLADGYECDYIFALSTLQSPSCGRGGKPAGSVEQGRRISGQRSKLPPKCHGELRQPFHQIICRTSSPASTSGTWAVNLLFGGRWIGKLPRLPGHHSKSQRPE